MLLIGCLDVRYDAQSRKLVPKEPQWATYDAELGMNILRKDAAGRDFAEAAARLKERTGVTHMEALQMIAHSCPNLYQRYLIETGAKE